MKIEIEPTPEVYKANINGQEIPLRVWKGRTSGGIEIEAYVLSIVPEHDTDHERMKAEMPPFMQRSRDAFHIEIPPQEDPPPGYCTMEEWAKSLHETGMPPKDKKW
jgi:hypothetical protein